MTTKLIAALMAGAMMIGPAFACQPSDIEIKQADWRVNSDGWITVVGELVNHCNEPTGAYFAFTFRDAAGKVVGVDTTNTGTLDVEPTEPIRSKNGPPLVPTLSQ